MLFLLFSFRGRINRAQYWLGTSLVGVATVVSQVLIAAISGGSALEAKTLAERFGAFAGASALVLPLTVLVLWSSLAIQFKRFHDRGRTGWISMAPIAGMLMLILTIVGDAMSNAPFSKVFDDIVPYFWGFILVGIGFFIDLGCLPSKEGPNRYGGPPGTPGARTTPPVPGGPPPKAFVSAQAAIDSAIARRDTAPVTPKPSAPAGRAAPMTLAPPAAPASAGPRAFGRRATR